MKNKLYPLLIGSLIGVAYFSLFFIFDNPLQRPGESTGWVFSFAHFPVIVIWAPVFHLLFSNDLSAYSSFIISLFFVDALLGAALFITIASIYRKVRKQG